MSILGDRLRKEREKRGWSQVFVAKKLGLKRSSTYANWEYGIRQPDLEMINTLSSLYDVDINELSGKVKKDKTKEDLIKEEKIKLAEEILNLPEAQKNIIMDMIKALKESTK